MTIIRFSARSVTGAGRGRHIGTPTINLDLADVPPQFGEGVYACRASWDGKAHKAAMHYGPRPVFGDDTTCEIHILGEVIEEPPERIDIHVVGRLRDVEHFPSPEALRAQIAEDIAQADAMLRDS